MKLKSKRKEELLASFGQLKDEYFEFDYIAAFFTKSKHDDALQVIDDKTCNDLDFHNFFTFIDRTQSSVGQQYLYDKMRVFPHHSRGQQLQEQLIAKITKETTFRLFIQEQLVKLESKNAYYIASLFQDEHRKPPKLFALMRLLPFLALAFLLAGFIHPVAFLGLFPVILTNLILHYWYKRVLSEYIGSIPALLKLHKLAHVFYKDSLLQQLKPTLSGALRVLDKLKRKMTIFSVEERVQGDLYSIVWGIYEFVKIIFLIEPINLFKVLTSLDTKRSEIKEIFDFVGEVDALLSVASLRAGVEDFCIPVFQDEGRRLSAEDMYHPLIRDCVKNTINVSQHSILLTGSNMSGKTSFIRTVALNAITAITLNTCFASNFTLPRVRLYSAIRISDDLLNDRSYYLEEVLTIKRMIDESTSNGVNLFILDEIFKGTNTVERIAAGKAVLSYLQKSNNIVFVSTHDIELADLLQEEYDLYHFSEEVTDKAIDFDYKLKSGKLKKKNAIRILGLNNYPESLIDEALTISEKIDRATFFKS